MGKSTRCQVCTSESRHAVEVGLVAGVSLRVLADRFNLHKDAIGRHARSHLSPAQRAAILAQVAPTPIDADELREREESGLLAAFVTQRARLLNDAERAREFGDMRTAVAAEKAYTDNLHVVARMVGQLSINHTVKHTGSIEILTSPDWLRIVDAIRGALRTYPEALVTVAAALHALELEAAADVTAARGKAPLTIEHAPQLAPPPY
jgi:hypothetical protein